MKGPTACPRKSGPNKWSMECPSLMRHFCSFDFKSKFPYETNFTTLYCFMCDQSITQQKNYKNGSVCNFTFKTHSWKLIYEHCWFLFFVFCFVFCFLFLFLLKRGKQYGNKGILLEVFYYLASLPQLLSVVFRARFF